MKTKNILLTNRMFVTVAVAMAANASFAQQANNDTDTARVGEVVVTALGIKKEKKKLGFAIAEVDGASLVKARETRTTSEQRYRHSACGRGRCYRLGYQKGKKEVGFCDC